MASLSEMMQYANYVGGGNSVTESIQSGLSGFMAGAQAKRAIQTQQLDTALKLLDIREKMQKIQIEDRKQTLNENMMKAFGFSSLSPSETSSATGTAWNMMGDGKNPQHPNTPQGKIAKMANNFDWLPGWSVKSGFSLRGVKNKDSLSRATGATEHRTAVEEERLDLQWAEKMARNEVYQGAIRGKDPLETKNIHPNTIPIPPDTLAKYVPIARALRTGDMKTYRKLIGDQSAPTTSPKVAVLSQAADLQKSLKQKSDALSDGGILWNAAQATQADPED